MAIKPPLFLNNTLVSQVVLNGSCEISLSTHRDNLVELRLSDFLSISTHKFVKPPI